MKKVFVIILVVLTLLCFTGCNKDVIEKLEGKISILEEQKTNINNKFIEHTNQLNKLKDEISDLKQENGKLIIKIDSLNTTLSNNKNEITDLINDIEMLKEQLSTLDNNEPN